MKQQWKRSGKRKEGMKLSLPLKLVEKPQKSNKRLMAITIKGKTKREGQRKASRRTTRRNQKRARASPSCGWKLRKTSLGPSYFVL